jgi:hypothetical protein
MACATAGDPFATLDIESGIAYLGMLSIELTKAGSTAHDTWTNLTSTWNYLYLFLKMKATTNTGPMS